MSPSTGNREKLQRALAHHRQGQFAEAEALYRKILAKRPNDVDANYHLGMMALQFGHAAAALPHLQLVVAAMPDNPEAIVNLGAIHHQLGQLDQAVACYRRVIELQPNLVLAHTNLGHALKTLGQFEAALFHCERAAALAPTDPLAQLNLGGLFLETGRLAEADQYYRRAMELKPDFPQAHLNRGIVLSKLGRQNDALACFREVLRLQPDNAYALSNIVYISNYLPELSADDVLRAARAFGAVAAARAQARRSWPNAADPDRPLRVGLVSGDLRAHPVGYFLETLLGAIDRRDIGLYAYASDPRHDSVSERLQANVMAWRSVVGMNDEAVARQVSADAIDILIDLSGHTAQNRLPVFAWRPAPVQATWLGYCGTTGVAAIDYIIGDRHVTPLDESAHLSERPWLLPESYMCFSAPPFDLPVGELPALKNGYVTFGSFNNLAKVNAEVVSCWAGALRAVADSRLLLRAPQLLQPSECQRILDAFAAQGVDASRLVLDAPLPSRQEGMAQYARVDIALDTFPYTGATTSVEAMYMGVPVLTRRGDRFLSHVGESLNRNVGLDAWIAYDLADFARRASALAADRQALAETRAGLRSRLSESPLCDAPRFAAAFSRGLRGMWQEWCGRQARTPAG